ncbi:hypothetical protein LZK98_11970 [Sphingomonas cannabina]|uniref:hypothetical protein n=1 Tax=Sphingomonas cannabina TaxID=2899123 RepID=UPI001F477569|nr:hypothetical protein [Sphingomonas cannabina]UIJ43809.1 hypothetical protein LZK98_11970 [Sphingomonas cannabina]
MTDIGPSLEKLRRDWSETSSAEAPTGMIARRVIGGVLDKLPVGGSVTIERIGERRLLIRRCA